MLAAVPLTEDLAGIAGAAAAHVEAGERVEAVLATEAVAGERTYLCAFTSPNGRTWLAFGTDGTPLTSRSRVRDAASIAALCEVAEDSAGGGRLEELRNSLLALRLTENPPGIDEAEAAAHELETTIASPPRIASPRYLDSVGAATLRLERALGNGGESPFAAAMRQALGAVEELAHEVESNYKLPLT
jgi:hypothetical protein